jgi:hypothetical protein
MDPGCEMLLVVSAQTVSQAALSGRYIAREYSSGLSSHSTVASTTMVLDPIRQS